jgi:carboxylate-amine ligase
VGFSNELAAHVFEIKTLTPQKNLTQAEAGLGQGLRYFTQVLQEQFGVRLLPTGMHPFMLPSETTLWRRAGRQIYRTYARLFPIHEHGWLNIQSCHVNLPFGTEQETVVLHNAIACLLPYLPALAASSPLYEGALGPHVDNRLTFYRTNQKRIPQITGQVIPEFMASYQQYRGEVLQPIYRALDGLSAGARLKHEWVNSRGAILRFNRRAIEIRVLDTQECIKMDIAITVFIRGALKRIVRQLQREALALPEHAMLVQDFNSVVARGSRARVYATHLRPPSDRSGSLTTPRKVLLRLLEYAQEETPEVERSYLPLVEKRIRGGNLSERIIRAIQQRGGRGQSQGVAAIRSVYQELMECLEKNTPWEG